jgi:hypothetical protein
LNPFKTPEQTLTQTATSWRPLATIFDLFAWLYPICFTAVAFTTTNFLRAQSTSISPMSYDFYYDSKDSMQQFWYDATLFMLILSPIVFLFSVCVQSAWNRGPSMGRWRYPAITIVLWITVPLFAEFADIPIMDYLID